jgi:hypothetical protein
VVYEELPFKVKVNEQTDGRQMKSDHISSPCHFVTGELKMKLLGKSVGKLNKVLTHLNTENTEPWKNYRMFRKRNDRKR